MIYLPSHPEKAKIYSARQLWLPMSIGTIFTAVCPWSSELLFCGVYINAHIH